MSGDRGAEFVGEEFPESPALGSEVVAGPQSGAHGFRAGAPGGFMSGRASRAGHEGTPWRLADCAGRSPGHTLSRMAKYAFADSEAMMA